MSNVNPPEVPDNSEPAAGAPDAVPPVAPPPPPAYTQPPPAAAQPGPGYGQPQPPQQPVSGHAAYGQPYAGVPAPSKSPLLSIFSLVAGAVGVLGSPIAFIPIIGGVFGLFVPAVAIVLGFIGKSKEPAAKGFWLTGIILGFVGVAIAVLSFILWAALLSVGSHYDYRY